MACCVVYLRAALAGQPDSALAQVFWDSSSSTLETSHERCTLLSGCRTRRHPTARSACWMCGRHPPATALPRSTPAQPVPAQTRPVPAHMQLRQTPPKKLPQGSPCRRFPSRLFQRYVPSAFASLRSASSRFTAVDRSTDGLSRHFELTADNPCPRIRSICNWAICINRYQRQDALRAVIQGPLTSVCAFPLRRQLWPSCRRRPTSPQRCRRPSQRSRLSRAARPGRPPARRAPARAPRPPRRPTTAPSHSAPPSAPRKLPKLRSSGRRPLQVQPQLRQTRHLLLRQGWPLRLEQQGGGNVMRRRQRRGGKRVRLPKMAARAAARAGSRSPNRLATPSIKLPAV